MGRRATPRSGRWNTSASCFRRKRPRWHKVATSPAGSPSLTVIAAGSYHSGSFVYTPYPLALSCSDEADDAITSRSHFDGRPAAHVGVGGVRRAGGVWTLAAWAVAVRRRGVFGRTSGGEMLLLPASG